jgi:hypothetical protein
MYGSSITDNTDDLSQVNDFDIELWNEPGDLAFLIDKALDLGISEPSCYPVTEKSIKYIYWSSVDSDTTYSMHINGLTDSQKMRIHNMIKTGRVDYDYLESIDSQLSLV